MTREVKKDVTTNAAGNKVETKTVQIDRPHKTIERVVVKETDAETGEVHKSRSRDVDQK